MRGHAFKGRNWNISDSILICLPSRYYVPLLRTQIEILTHSGLRKISPPSPRTCRRRPRTRRGCCTPGARGWRGSQARPCDRGQWQRGPEIKGCWVPCSMEVTSYSVTMAILNSYHKHTCTYMPIIIKKWKCEYHWDDHACQKDKNLHVDHKRWAENRQVPKRNRKLKRWSKSNRFSFYTDFCCK